LTKVGVLKLRVLGRGKVKGRCPLFVGEEGAEHILLGCTGTKIWRTEYIAQKTHKNIGHLNRIKCKWGNKAIEIENYGYKVKKDAITCCLGFGCTHCLHLQDRSSQGGSVSARI
jgi:hypothetical protein